MGNLCGDQWAQDLATAAAKPAVANSELPGLLGLASLTRLNAILDLGKRTLHLAGPGDYDLEKALPSGMDHFQLVNAPSGHLLLPCSHFSKLPEGSHPTTALLTEEAGKSNETASRGPDLATMAEAAVENLLENPSIVQPPPPPLTKPDLVLTNCGPEPNAPLTEPTVHWNNGDNR